MLQHICLFVCLCRPNYQWYHQQSPKSKTRDYLVSPRSSPRSSWASFSACSCFAFASKSSSSKRWKALRAAFIPKSGETLITKYAAKRNYLVFQIQLLFYFSSLFIYYYLSCFFFQNFWRPQMKKDKEAATAAATTAVGGKNGNSEKPKVDTTLAKQQSADVQPSPPSRSSTSSW